MMVEKSGFGTWSWVGVDVCAVKTRFVCSCKDTCIAPVPLK